MPPPSALLEFTRRKEQAALAARFRPFRTEVDRASAFPVETVSTELTDRWLDGPFYQSPLPSPPVPLVSLVFVQSRDGNTEAGDPSELGGGQTDKHLVYEGLSRVTADAVLAGAKTAGDGSVVFSVWHPALVALRRALGKPRHPVQIVATSTGALPIEDALLYNVPEIRVVLVSAGQAATGLAERCRSRPWISVISSGRHPDLRVGIEMLRRDYGVSRVSAVGGRTLATALIDAKLVTDVYLTTSPIDAGAPNTPMYAGTPSPSRQLVVRKRSADGGVFEHFIYR